MAWKGQTRLLGYVVYFCPEFWVLGIHEKTPKKFQDLFCKNGSGPWEFILVRDSSEYTKKIVGEMISSTTF